MIYRYFLKPLNVFVHFLFQLGLYFGGVAYVLTNKTDEGIIASDMQKAFWCV